MLINSTLFGIIKNMLKFNILLFQLTGLINGEIVARILKYSLKKARKTRLKSKRKLFDRYEDISEKYIRRLKLQRRI